MAKGAARPAPLRIRFAWPTPADLRGSVLPLLWMASGLLASYIYMDTALFSAVLLANEGPVPKLPVPFFPPQAIILSVLLLTPPRRWWLYLLAYYAIQVTQGTWYGMPRLSTLLTNATNVVEALV